MRKIPLTIKRFEPKYLNEILEIERESFKYPYDKSIFLSLYRIHPDGFIIALYDSRVVGYIIAIPWGFKGKIMSIAVRREFRRKGIGRMLMEEAIKHLANLGFKEIDLEVRVSNIEAIKLYEKLGFKIIDRIKCYYPDGEDAYVMELKL